MISGSAGLNRIILDGDVYKRQPLINEVCDTESDYVAWNGTDDIKAVKGSQIVVVEIDSAGKAKAAGIADVTVKEA